MYNVFIGDYFLGDYYTSEGGNKWNMQEKREGEH